MNANTIAEALGLRKSGSGYRGPCPVCGGSDKATKFTLREDGDRTLLHCFAGCSQEEIIAELCRRGLWREASPLRAMVSLQRQRQDRLLVAKAGILLAEAAIKRGERLDADEVKRLERWRPIAREAQPAAAVQGSTRRKLPPFGKQVKASRYYNTWVCAGRDGWQRAIFRNSSVAPGSALVLPLDTKPQHFMWPVRGLALLISWPDGTAEQIKELGTVLIQSGASSVTAPCEHDPEGCLYFRGRRAAA